ncbi:Jacalin-related lectin 18 [Cardamine amara subsp. amara]|uniref:Jacalin-related lectin 18 n=1 Tax=Cardamine amara subsp. amara TaxID=228776 RepID=A0ABD1B0A1_CARAN
MTQRLETQGSHDRNYEWDDGSEHDDVTKISVRGDFHGIQYIRFEYIKSGQLKYGSFHGWTSPGLSQTFEINHLKGEQLESVEGYYEPNSGVIQGIQFKTNLRISELIGFEEKGTKFSLAVDGKKIIGFHGSSTSKLKSLGAYFTRICPTRLEVKGRNEGMEWNDGAEHEGVTKICVRGGPEGIQFIKFEYVMDGKHICGPTHGVSARGFTQPFEINHFNKEYLVSVEGYYDNNDKCGVIQGLQFKTNIKTSELMGYDQGKKFKLAANGKKIIGFHGYAEKNLNALGAYFTTFPFTKLEYKGDTTSGKYWDDGAFEGLRKVYVHFNNSHVNCVTFDYDNNGKVEKREHGSMAGKEGEFVVDFPNEFITSVEGTLETDGYTWVSSLTFKTSKEKTSPTFGSVSKTKFVLENTGCALVGFHGRSNACIFSLGAYFHPLSLPVDVEKLEAKGGDKGDSWDDGSFDGIRNIYMGHSEMGVAFVKFLYDKDNQAVIGDDHGCKTLLRVDEFELEYPSEYLISVEGSCDIVDGSESEVIRMLRFKTNMRTSKVYGLKTTSSFILQKGCHKIVGFHGKVSNILHQIGVHVLPITD